MEQGKREKVERFVVYFKVKYRISDEHVYHQVFGGEFEHYPNDDELFELWDNHSKKPYVLIWVKVEKQVRFN